MKLSDTLLAAYNKQITMEIEASLVYRQLGIVMAAADLPGMAQWLRVQADEEIGHAYQFIDHVLDRDQVPTIGALAAPVVPSGDSPAEVFAAALAHEERVSAAIRELYRTAEEAGDLDSRPLLNTFLQEQIEEESTVRGILSQIRLVGNDGVGLLRLDAELGARPASGA
ncbi:MAG: ferritin [Actinomycetia bacterium]|nr:ferritin [Actinomycetes bacterium]